MFSTHPIYPHENDVVPTFKEYFSDDTKYTALLDSNSSGIESNES